MFEALKFTAVDIDLMILCPIAGGIGGFLRFLCQAVNFDNLLGGSGRSGIENASFANVSQMFASLEWLLGHVILSAAAGLMVGLYFVGSVKGDPTTIARLLALSILVGYAAPRLWRSQEKSIISLVEKTIARELGRYDLEKKSNSSPIDNEKSG